MFARQNAHISMKSTQLTSDLHLRMKNCVPNPTRPDSSRLIDEYTCIRIYSTFHTLNRFNSTRIEDNFIISSRQSRSTLNKNFVGFYKRSIQHVCFCLCVLMTDRLMVEIEYTSRCNLLMFNGLSSYFSLIDAAIYQRVNIWYIICLFHTIYQIFTAVNIILQCARNFQTNTKCTSIAGKTPKEFSYFLLNFSCE